MRIGPVEISHPVILAPLAGITDSPFRLLAREYGCPLVYSEMISANGLAYHSQRTRRMLANEPAEKPLAIQIFGANPAYMAQAAREAAAAGADMVDINFGCSVRKVLKTGAGAALMKSPAQAEAVIRAVREAIAVPLTIKIRSGWDASGRDAFALVEIAEKCGVDAVAVHPRTATQGFGGRADWRLIAEIKRRAAIPIIGNGDIQTAADVRRMLAETACDAVMIGRAAIGNPWIFAETVALLEGRDWPHPAMTDRCDAMGRYFSAVVAFYGEAAACRMMRSRLGWFVRGLPSSSHFREAIKRLSSRRQGEILIRAYRDFLRDFSDTEKLIFVPPPL